MTGLVVLVLKDIYKTQNVTYVCKYSQCSDNI